MDITRTQTVIAYDAAARLVAEALGHARAEGWNVAAAVVDPAGEIVAAGRLDGVAPATLQIALDKAYTTTLGRSTAAFLARMSEDRLALGLSNRPRLCAWEGGLPLRRAGALIGGMGVSGAAGHEDAACIAAALAAVGLDPAT